MARGDGDPNPALALGALIRNTRNWATGNGISKSEYTQPESVDGSVPVLFCAEQARVGHSVWGAKVRFSRMNHIFAEPDMSRTRTLRV